MNGHTLMILIIKDQIDILTLTVNAQALLSHIFMDENIWFLSLTDVKFSYERVFEVFFNFVRINKMNSIHSN